MKRNNYVLSVALLLAAQALLCAPADARKMTLEECIDSALAINPRLQAAGLELKRAEQLRGTAFDPENTEVTLKQETTGGGGPDNGVMFSQGFEFPSVYVAKGKTLRMQQRLESKNFEMAVADLSRDVALEYQNALYLNRLMGIGESLENHYRKFYEVTRARHEAGDCSALEVMNAERMLEKSQMELRGIRSDYDVALNRLGNMTGCEAEPEYNGIYEIMEHPGPSEWVFSDTPSGALAATRIQLAESEINLEKQKFLPGINLGVTVQALIKDFNPYGVPRERFSRGNFMGFEAGLTLPVFFWSQTSRLKAARTQRNIAMLQQESTAAEAMSEYSALRVKLDTEFKNILNYREKSLPRAGEIRRLAEISYSLGEIDYIEYIANIQTAFDIEKEYAEAVFNYNKTLILINHLTGK